MWEEDWLSSVPLDAEHESKDEVDGLENGGVLLLSSVVGEGRTSVKVIVSASEININIRYAFF